MFPAISDYQKIGIGLSGFGIAFIFLGVLMMFDKGLLAMGNILFLAGLGFVIGLERTFRFFFQKHKLRGSGCFFGGILIVLLGWPIIGMCVEAYGFFILFSGFFPVVINFLRRIPGIGNLLNLPGIRTVVNKLSESPSMV
ncbi:vesicle transport protein GOT1B-like [Sycon ciliatum]|uniref:vesicle transport protein GOT1B-like n=1 Tax=Sycon ciliatum TaxID=27933 RepID=UPI0020AB9DC1